MIGTYEKSGLLRELVDSGQLELALEPEAILITEMPNGGKTTLLACAFDTRGLNYALYELAERINAQSLPAIYHHTQEKPFLKRRGVVHFLTAQDLKKGWNFSQAYWQGYFDMLVRNRFNTFTLVLNAPSLASILIYLVDLPEHPEVKPSLFSTPSRRGNLETLQRFVELATAAGLDFYLGLRNFPGNTTLQTINCGLNPDNFESYLFLALKQLLFACPLLKGLEVKFDEEPLEPEFLFNTIQRAILETGNQLALKLYSSQTTPETLNPLLESKVKIILNSNCWEKQSGLAYLRDLPVYTPHEALVVNYQLFSATSLLWGDLDYVLQLMQALQASLISGLDLIPPRVSESKQEWSANESPPQSAPSLRGNYERYWFYYHLFGRLAFNSRTTADVLIREFHHRFGEKGNDLVDLYQLTSKVVPLFNMIHKHNQPTPELHTGGLLDYYQRVPVGDSVFFSTVQEYTRAVITGATPDKLSPPTIAAHLINLGTEISQKATQLREDLPRRGEEFLREWQDTLFDARLLAHFALYHGRKLQAAIELSFFAVTKDLTSLNKAIMLLTKANRSWEKMIRISEQNEWESIKYRYLPSAESQKRLLLLEDENRLKALRDEYNSRGHFLIGIDFGGLPRLQPEDAPLTEIFPDYYVEQGFTFVDELLRYDPRKGYGWLDPTALYSVSSPPVRLMEHHFLPSSETGGNSYTPYENQLLNDLVWSRKPATFRVDLHPGTYQLHLTLCDRSVETRRHGPMKITANNIVLADELLIPTGQRVDLRHELTVEDGSLLVDFDCLPHQDWFISALSISPVAPSIAHTPVTELVRDEPLVIHASVTGSHSLRQVILNYQTESEHGYHMITMAPQATNLYLATIPALYLKEGKYVKYYITAYDTRGLKASLGSAELPFTITVKTKNFSPFFFHLPPTGATAARDLTLKISPRPLAEVENVTLVYNDEGEKDHQLTMEKKQEAEEYSGTIPGSLLRADYLLKYRFIVLFKDGNLQPYPNPVQANPYFLVRLT